MTDDSATQDELDNETLRYHWIVILAEYWRQADWEQFSGQQKSRVDSFGERLEAASHEGTIHKAQTKLAHGLGMSIPDLPTANLDPLTNHGTRSLEVLREERIYIVNRVEQTVQAYFDAQDSDGETRESGDETAPTTSKLSDFVTED